MLHLFKSLVQLSIILSLSFQKPLALFTFKVTSLYVLHKMLNKPSRQVATVPMEYLHKCLVAKQFDTKAGKYKGERQGQDR